jgi:transcriptional regulator with XRE-family HTH domain
MTSRDVATLIKFIRGRTTNRELARRAGVEPMSITRWTNGTRISLVDFAKLCKAQDKPLTKIFKTFEKKRSTVSFKFSIPEEFTQEVETIVQEAVKLENLNKFKDEPGALIVLATKQIRQLRELLEEQSKKSNERG